MLKNEKLLQEDIRKCYQTIRIAKAVLGGHRDARIIADKAHAPINLVHYYLNKYLRWETNG